ncbi:MAG: 3-hydroxyacyl-CoA dehydrogenase [Gemmatimonadota bacterium]
MQSPRKAFTLAAAAALVAAGLALPATAVAQANEGAAEQADVRLFFLNIRSQVLSANADGSDVRVLVDDLDTAPDGIAVDVANGHVYWSNMGASKENDGSVMRADLDGGNVRTIVPSGGTFTAKQLTLDSRNRKLYWSDREGMKIQRVNLDGTGLETLVEIASGDEARQNAANWAVGIAVDSERGHVYWTQKGGDNEGVGSIRRAGIDIPAGQTAANRKDIEVLFAGLPEPIDLDLDHASRQIYWTDRGDAPRGNTVNRAPMDPPANFDPANRKDAVILTGGFEEAIGLALDLKRDRMFITDLRGNVYSARIDGSQKQKLGTGLGSLTGISLAELARPATN